MPVVSSRGLIAMAGGSYEWPAKTAWNDLNQQPPVGPYARGLRWRNADTPIYSHVTDANRLEQFDCLTQTPLVVGDYFTQLVAGGGQWATFSNQGYRDSHGTLGQYWFPQCVDTMTGDIFVTIDDTGRDLYVWDGHDLELVMRGIGFGTSSTNGTLVIWCNQSWYHWTRQDGLSFVGSLGTVYPGAQWCCGYNLGWYGAQGSQVIWPDWHPEAAIVICQGIDNFNAVIYRETATSPIITVVGSRGPGELPGEQQVFTVDLTNQTVDGVPWRVVDLHGAPSLVVPSFPPRAISCVPFDVPPPAPQVIGPDDPAVGDVRYVLWTTTTGEPSQPAVSKAQHVGCQVLAYVDKPVFTPPVSVPRETMGIQCYPRHGDSPEATFARLDANVATARNSGRPFALVTPVYTGSGAWDAQLCLDINRWAWDQGVDVVPFGIIRPPHYPEFDECLKRMLAAAQNNHPHPPDPDEDDMPTLLASHFHPYWENPNTYALQGDPNDPRWLRLNLEGVISWRAGTNHDGPDRIESDSAFEWAPGKPTATAYRNGTIYVFKVDLTR